MMDILSNNKIDLSGMTAGEYLTTFYNDKLSLPDILTAAKFSFAHYPNVLYDYTKQLPMGCHYFTIKTWYDEFWRDKIHD